MQSVKSTSNYTITFWISFYPGRARIWRMREYILYAYTTYEYYSPIHTTQCSQPLEKPASTSLCLDLQSIVCKYFAHRRDKANIVATNQFNDTVETPTKTHNLSSTAVSSNRSTIPSPSSPASRRRHFYTLQLKPMIHAAAISRLPATPPSHTRTYYILLNSARLDATMSSYQRRQ